MNIHKVTAIVGWTPALFLMKLFGWIDLTWMHAIAPFFISLFVLMFLQYRNTKQEGLL